jgi:hypothetical protein
MKWHTGVQITDPDNQQNQPGNQPTKIINKLLITNISTYQLTTTSVAVNKPTESKQATRFATRPFPWNTNWELLPSICSYLFPSLTAAVSDWLRRLARIKIHFMPQETHLLTSAEQSH